jgi:hypothetical protein
MEYLQADSYHIFRLLWLISVHPETPDEKLLVFNSETRIFSSWQGNQGGLRGGVHRYAAQVKPLIDAARAEKDRFRMKTN